MSHPLLFAKGKAASACRCMYRAVQLAAIAAALLTAACGGGGGGGIAPATSITGNSPSAGSGGTGSSGGSGTGGSSPAATDGSGTRSSVGTDTGGLSASVPAATPASFGAAPLPAQIATAGGPTFDGSGGSFPSNVSFPAAASSLQFPSPWDYGGVSAVATSQSASVTVISTSATSTSFQLIVPAVNLDTTINFNENLVRNTEGVTWGLSYVALGAWAQYWPPANSREVQSFTEFLFGYETPAASMPTTGQAAFSGYADANIFAPSPVNVHVLLTRASGDAALTADFASGKITGAFTHMQYLANSSSVPWNDVSVNASILAGTNKFSGSAGVTSTPQTTFSLKGSATGHIDGAFYGPNAQNLGAIWSLSDGTTSVIGGVAAGR
jgi:hypothetical protein